MPKYNKKGNKTMPDINKQIPAIVNAAYADAMGGASPTTIESISDLGDITGSIVTIKEPFTKALIVQCARNWFTDTSYRDIIKDPYFVDEREYGAITQMITAEAPAVQESHAWKSFVSGTSTVGVYTLYIPIVESKLYGKTGSWELPVAISDEQWDDAVRSGEELADFVAYVMMIVDNAIVCHIENMNALNRNNFIAEKIEASGDSSITGLHVVDLMAAYNAERGGNISTVVGFLADPEAMRFAACKIDEYTSYFSRMSKMFNTEGKARFTPDERKVVEVIKKFASAMAEVNYATTFNANYTQLPDYTEVPFWQGFGAATSFDEVTSIAIQIGEDEKAYHNVVALIADKWAIMHTIRKHRVAVTRHDPEAITQYYYQFRDSYMNNLGMNGLVFTIGDPVVS